MTHMTCSLSDRHRPLARLRLALAFVLAIGAGAACQSPQPSPRPLVLATGLDSGLYYLLGGTLVDIYNGGIPGVATSALSTTGSGFNVRAVEDGRADLAFTQADVAYLALQHGTRDHPSPHRQLSAIAVLYMNTVQVVALAESNIRQLGDLQGRRVAVGAPDSGTEIAAQIILNAHGAGDRIIQKRLVFDDLLSSMRNRTIDAGFLISSYPLPSVAQLNESVGIRLLPIDAALASRIQAEYPFYRPAVVPANTYENQRSEIPTIGVDNLLVCRTDLPDDLVYQLTRVFFESLPRLAQTHSAAAMIDAEQASAAPIPLHPGAARFYRERDLFR